MITIGMFESIVRCLSAGHWVQMREGKWGREVSTGWSPDGREFIYDEILAWHIPDMTALTEDQKMRLHVVLPMVYGVDSDDIDTTLLELGYDVIDQGNFDAAKDAVKKAFGGKDIYWHMAFAASPEMAGALPPNPWQVVIEKEGDTTEIEPDDKPIWANPDPPITERGDVSPWVARYQAKVVIGVLGGVAYIKECSPGVEVKIIDYDDLKERGLNEDGSEADG